MRDSSRLLTAEQFPRRNHEHERPTLAMSSFAALRISLPHFDRVVKECLAMRCASPATQDEQDRRRFFPARMICSLTGTTRLLKDQMKGVLLNERTSHHNGHAIQRTGRCCHALGADSSGA